LKIRDDGRIFQFACRIYLQRRKLSEDEKSLFLGGFGNRRRVTNAHCLVARNYQKESHDRLMTAKQICLVAKKKDYKSDITACINGKVESENIDSRTRHSKDKSAA
jgi:hypothetical protein